KLATVENRRELHSVEQKQAVGIIMAAPWDALSMAVLSDLNILPLQKRVANLKAKMVFKAFNGLLRSYIAE
ncbi:unnamed protein product, partial [Porites evermanni]